MTAPMSDSLRLRLDIPPEPRAGTTVPITLRVENLGDRPIELYLRGRTIAFDVVVRRPAGEVVWRRLAGEVIPAIIQLRVLAPREVLELRAEWPQRTDAGVPVGPGHYLVQGVLLTDDPTPLQTDPVPLRVIAH